MRHIPTLIARCQQGDLRAFAALFDHYQDQLFDLACAILDDREAAKDAVQDTFLAVFQKIGNFRGDAAFDTWLTAILINQCRQKLRYRKLRRALSLDNLRAGWLRKAAGQPENPATVVAERQQKQALWAMVNELDDRLRLPILLRYRYGFSCPEIAEALGLSVNTIYDQLSQARRQLRQLRQEREARALPIVDEMGHG
jgi:RNA polymerase sigma-70 factor, ECF subfamily